MYHQFNTKIAKQYGLEESILLENIYFWVKKNKANNQNYHNGKYWTYNTVKAFNELFDYIPETKIYRTLKNLEKCGLIEIDEFNENKYDHTKWYTVTEKTLKLFDDDFKNEKSNLNNEETILQNEEPILQNEKSNLQNTKISITDNKHSYLNTDNKQQIKETARRFIIPTLEEIQNYCNERQNKINPEYFLDYYTARDWKFNNGGKMKDWKATIRNWERLERNREQQQNRKSVFDENKLIFD